MKYFKYQKYKQYADADIYSIDMNSLVAFEVVVQKNKNYLDVEDYYTRNLKKNWKGKIII